MPDTIASHSTTDRQMCSTVLVGDAAASHFSGTATAEVPNRRVASLQSMPPEILGRILSKLIPEDVVPLRREHQVSLAGIISMSLAPSILPRLNRQLESLFLTSRTFNEVSSDLIYTSRALNIYAGGSHRSSVPDLNLVQNLSLTLLECFRKIKIHLEPNPPWAQYHQPSFSGTLIKPMVCLQRTRSEVARLCTFRSVYNQGGLL